MEVKTAIRSFRKQMKLSQSRLARLLGVTTATISNWERGHTKPDQRVVLDRIKEVVGSD